MFEVMRREKLEDFVVIGGLVVLQFLCAGNTVFAGYIMSFGFNPLSLTIINSVATVIVLSPAAVYFERVTVFQSCTMKGIALTSPAIATAMPNLSPAVIFVIAWIARLEKVDFSCTYSRVKILGTLFCVVGALAMSLLQSASPKQVHGTEATSHFDQQRILGCAFLMVAVLGLSICAVVQAVALVEFPAPISICLLTSLIGGALTALLELLQSRTIDLGLQILGVRGLIGLSILGGIMGGGCFSFAGWALKKKGPVLVSMFSPIATVISVLLSVVKWGEMISLGSFAGIILMFTGLYFVLWAKGKENVVETGLDAEKPLLS
ncbi:EamA domain [Dillenia turbinata]|uniref:WAT1-related protein n=1 Tax=Dillenia turbinata TaxID=194707 RepID=A0AAN8ZC87_9MAGN